MDQNMDTDVYDKTLTLCVVSLDDIQGCKLMDLALELQCSMT